MPMKPQHTNFIRSVLFCVGFHQGRREASDVVGGVGGGGGGGGGGVSEDFTSMLKIYLKCNNYNKAFCD
jgi:hypothetical protein